MKVHGLMDFIARNHSCDTPGIVVHRPMTVHAKYLTWVEAEMRRPGRR
ncbi:MAG: hypothetical protein KDK07_18615 [Bauldia sp.]|nr:hypothetical protein [Bauldia sp.]